MSTKRTDRPVENTEERAPRTRRTFIEDTADILTVRGKDPDYVYRWVNDERGRVQRMQDAGYDVVLEESLSIGTATEIASGSANTITTDRIHGVKGILMRIRKEFAEEDGRARAAMIDRTEDSLFRAEREADGRYGDVGFESDD